MTAADNIRNSIIDKLLTITNQEYLEALFQMLDKSGVDNDIIQLSEAQKQMLSMSDEDIKNNRLTDYDELDKRDLEWLKGL